MKKILMVADSFYPDNIGGSEKVLYHLCRYLVGKGIQVFVLVRRGPVGTNYSDVLDGINIRRYDDSKRSFGMLYVPSVVNLKKAFKKITSEISFDVFHFHHPLTAHALLNRKLNGVYSFYGPAPEEFKVEVYDRKSGFPVWKRLSMPLWIPLKYKVLRKMEKDCLEKSYKIIVNSEFMKTLVLNNYGNQYSEKIEIIPGGIDIELFKPAGDKAGIRKALNIPENKFILLTVRRLVARMGLENLIEAMPKVLNFNPDVHLVIAGKGYLRERLEKSASGLNVSNNITFTGFVKDEDLPLYYRASDLFVLPTKALEGFGLVTVESLASGVPVLGTAVGSTVEILNKFDASMLIPDFTADSIADKIIWFLKKKDTNELSLKCRKFAEEYSWNKVCGKIFKIYESIAYFSRIYGK